VVERMAAASSQGADAARAAGVAIAREMLLAIRDLVQGAQVSAPLSRYPAALDVIDALGSSRRTAVV